MLFKLFFPLSFYPRSPHLEKPALSTIPSPSPLFHPRALNSFYHPVQPDFFFFFSLSENLNQCSCLSGSRAFLTWSSELSHFLQGEEDQLLLPTLQPLYSYRCGKEVIYLIGEFRKNKSGARSLALPTPKTLLSALGCLTAENIFLHCSSRSKSSPLLLRSVCKLA